MSAHIPLFQPENLDDPAFLQKIQSLKAECAAVVAYGKFLPQNLLQLFPQGAVNLHASLLPKYRGAAPIQWALINGEQETGVTVFQLDNRLDHGPVLLQVKHPIQPDETGLTLSDRLAELGAMTLVRALDLIESVQSTGTPQDESAATTAPLLKKENGIIDWAQPCQVIHNRIRGLQPWPGAVTWLGKDPMKIFLTHPDPKQSDPAASPGTVVKADPKAGLWIQTGGGQLEIRKLQPEGGKIMEAADYLRGHPIGPGSVLTSSPSVAGC